MTFLLTAFASVAWSAPAADLCLPSHHNPLLTRIQATAPAEAHPGFLPPNDPRLPAEVKAAGDSTFQIVMPAGEKVTLENILGPGHTLDDVVRYVGTLPIDRVERLALQYQVRACVKAPVPMKCQIFGGTMTGSAYLTGDGKTLRTALHNVRDYALDHVRRDGPPRQTLSLPIFVFDRRGRPVIAPPVGSATGEIDVKDLYAGQANQGGFTAPGHDQVEIKLGKSLGRPLPRAAAPPAAGEPLYLASYPRKTEDRATLGGSDSPGFQLRVSPGRVLSDADVARRMGFAPSAMASDTKAFLRDLVASDVDGAPQSSGGVLLNARGEYVGTYTAGNPADGHASTTRVSYGSNETRGANVSSPGW